tara:strand:- start:2458 stop:3126 length:669 start_codon:yes stop_codon:yes gene_type:complete
LDKVIIAIDGFASTGKSTLAKKLSQHLGLRYVDSGALFRGITFWVLKNGWVSDDNLNELAIEKGLYNLNIFFDSVTNILSVNGIDVTEAIRSKEVSAQVSQIAKLSFVRSFLLNQQRQMSLRAGLVMDGRDIGTVVFPNADFKFFFTAKPEVRAQRRLEEMEASGHQANFADVLKNILDRDRIDSQRKISPLKKAADAIEINTSELSLEQAFDLLIAKINTK